MSDSGAACALPPRPAAPQRQPSTSLEHTSLAEVADGRFVRTASVYRNKIQKGGEFPPASGRYHLYISLACPWAHRTLIFRKLKGLEKAIGISIVEPAWGPIAGEHDIKHWVFSPAGDLADNVNHLQSLRAVYKYFNNSHEGKATTPLLVDLQTKRIVNNESAEIVAFFNSEFNEFAEHPSLDLIPTDLKPKITEINDMIYNTLNNGVYRCGFATTQGAYDEAFRELFDTLDKLEILLSKQRYTASNTHVTESDVRLFVTLIRFDAVYVVHFKTNKKRIADYPNLLGFVRDIYQYKGIGDTVDFWHFKNHYFRSHPSINPHGIVPAGPELPDYKAPHDRQRFTA